MFSLHPKMFFSDASVLSSLILSITHGFRETLNLSLSNYIVLILLLLSAAFESLFRDRFFWKEDTVSARFFVIFVIYCVCLFMSMYQNLFVILFSNFRFVLSSVERSRLLELLTHVSSRQRSI